MRHLATIAWLCAFLGKLILRLGPMILRKYLMGERRQYGGSWPGTHIFGKRSGQTCKRVRINGMGLSTGTQCREDGG